MVDTDKKARQQVDPKARKGICPICQAVVRYPSALSYLRNHQAQSETKAEQQQQQSASTGNSGGELEKVYYTSRTYVDAFLQSPTYDLLLDISFHGVNNMRRIRKEVTESYSALQFLKRCDLNHTFLIDLCSGKSLTTVLCRILYKEGRFLAVDKLHPDNIAHDVEYWSVDVMSKTFAQRLVSEVHLEAEQQQRTVILIGMHLCGTLSERAIQLFADNVQIQALLLCPCCLPKNPKGAVSELRNRLRKSDTRSHNDMYQGWVELLYQQLVPIENVTIERYTDVDMHSDRNCLFWVTRNT